MGKPTEEELAEALAEAGRMREAGEDPRHVAKVLLNHHYRLKLLEQVARAAERYVKFGEDVRAHRELVSALEAYHRADAHTAGADLDEVPGL